MVMSSSGKSGSVIPESILHTRIRFQASKTRADAIVDEELHLKVKASARPRADQPEEKSLDIFLRRRA
jgi:hypothetical protein